MINNLEIEYKILLNENQFNTLSALYPNKTFIKQVNTYYDTKNHDLRKNKCAMRIREKEGKFLITLKTPASVGHHEYECYVNENSPEIFNQSEIRLVLDALHISNEFIELASCTTYRAVCVLDKAELCFDYNEYNGICDYEIEYEQTEDHDGMTEFNKILSKIGLVYEKNCDTKIKRALQSL